MNMQSSRDAPLNNAETETAPVCYDDLSSRPSRSQQEDDVILGDMDLKFEMQPDDQDGEEEDAPGEADVGQDGELSAEEIEFLEDFPGWKLKQEQYIAALRAFAEEADRVSRTFAKKKILNKCVTVASELVSFAGLALAPATVGASLPLTVAGQGVAVLSAVWGVKTELSEKSCNDNLRARANRQVPNPDQNFEDTGGKKMSYVSAAGQAVYKFGRAWEIINKRMHTLLPTKPLAKPLSYLAGKTLPKSILPMAKAASVSGGPVAVLSLATDVYSLRENWKKLGNEAKAELAEDLRDRAKELEDELILKSELYDTLKQKKLLREKQLTGSSSKKAKETQILPPSRSGKAESQGTGKKTRASDKK